MLPVLLRELLQLHVKSVYLIGCNRQH